MFKAQSTFWLILITGLGFFIDSFDAFSYNVMRVPSLMDLGLSGDALTRAGMTILNWQVFGILVGGFVWGLLGDKIGRKKALLGSIVVYSIAMLANAFVHDVTLYTVLRFCVGLGIAGEVGLASALVGESLPKEKRTFGLAVMTLLGLLGVAAAALSIESFHWRVLCFIGGMAGFALLIVRGLLLESPLFSVLETQQNFLAPLKFIFATRKTFLRYIGCSLLLAPNFFITGVMLTLSPELAKSLHIDGPVKANIVIGSYFVIAVLGDLFGSCLTSKLHSRKRAIALFMAGNLVLVMTFLHMVNGASALLFYSAAAAIGLFNVWALSATVAVEQFSTELRATATTSVLTVARGMIIVFNLAVLALKPAYGLVNALTIVGIAILGIGFVVSYLMRETYYTDLAIAD